MADRGHELTDELLKELEKKIAGEYRKANREIQAKLKDYMEQYKAEDEIMRQRLLDKEITRKEYGDWRYRKMMNKRQWENLRDSLAADYHNANALAMSMAEGCRPEVYALNHNYAAYQIEHDYLIDTSYTLYSAEAVERLMRDNPELLPPLRPGGKTARKLAANKDLRWNRQKIQSAVTQGILQGESIDKIAGRLLQVSDMNYHAALRNARTMITGAQNAGRNDSYDRIERNGTELSRVWISVLDNRVRHSHRQMHGEIRDGESFSNGLEYPGDPSGDPAEVYNCRCSMRCFVKGYERVPKSSPKMGDMSFEEWQSEKAVANSARHDIMASGSETMTIHSIDSPIEQRHTGKGKPAAITHYDVELNNRQQRLLDQLQEFDSRISVAKDEVGMIDLSALTAKTGDEFALFTKGGERLVIRGNNMMVRITVDDAKKLAAMGYTWSGHTHPGTGFNCLQASPGDMQILACFDQARSVIYNSVGERLEFWKE